MERWVGQMQGVILGRRRVFHSEPLEYQAEIVHAGKRCLLICLFGGRMFFWEGWEAEHRRRDATICFPGQPEVPSLFFREKRVNQSVG